MKNPAGKGGVKKDKRQPLSTPSQNPFPAPRRPDQTVAAVLQLLQEQWPKCFAVLETRRRPLKVGIHNEILEALSGAVTQAELANALANAVAGAASIASKRIKAEAGWYSAPGLGSGAGFWVPSASDDLGDHYMTRRSGSTRSRWCV